MRSQWNTLHPPAQQGEKLYQYHNQYRYKLNYLNKGLPKLAYLKYVDGYLYLCGAEKYILLGDVGKLARLGEILSLAVDADFSVIRVESDDKFGRELLSLFAKVRPFQDIMVHTSKSVEPDKIQDVKFDLQEMPSFVDTFVSWLEKEHLAAETKKEVMKILSINLKG